MRYLTIISCVFFLISRKIVNNSIWILVLTCFGNYTLKAQSSLDSIYFKPSYSLQDLPKANVSNTTISQVPSIRVMKVLDSIALINQNIKFTDGYRILVYSGNDKQASLEAKEKLYQMVPSIPIYAIYKQPTYRIKLGDFTDKLSAHRVLSTQIKKVFPSAFVIPELVHLTKK